MERLKEADLDERVGELVDAVMELTSGKKLSDKNFRQKRTSSTGKESSSRKHDSSEK